MKKLSKIRLHNAIVMNDCEMKSVTGGFVTGGEDSGTGQTGMGTACGCYGSGCEGSCPDRYEGSYVKGYKRVAQSCQSEILWNHNYSVGMEICVCK